MTTRCPKKKLGQGKRGKLAIVESRMVLVDGKEKSSRRSYIPLLSSLTILHSALLPMLP